MKSIHSVRGNLQYRSTVWICRRLLNDLCSEDTCPPISMFQWMINHNHTTWGHYAVYITWLHRHHPSEGIKVFDYLKKHHANNMYSFWYLASSPLVYYVNEIIRFVCRSYRAWITGRCCQICQSTQDSRVQSQEGTTTSTELHSAQTKTSAV